MAFNRAYTVRYNLAKLGVSDDRLRIVAPDDALAELDADGASTPQVVATLLTASDTPRAADTHAPAMRYARVSVPHPAEPLRLAMAFNLTEPR